MKKAVKVPVVMQMEALECIPACLAMILAYYGRYEPLEKLRSVCGVSRDGSNMKELYYAAKEYGLIPHAYNYSIVDLQERDCHPCVLYWDYSHFVILDGFQGKKAVINDPARGRIKITMEELNRSYSGMCMTFEVTDAFRKEGTPPSVADFLSTRLSGSRSLLILALITSFIAAVMGIISPGFQGFFVDAILTGLDDDWVIPFFVLFGIVALLQLLAAWCKASYLLKLEGKLSIAANTSFVWHILRLPVTFYEQRWTGDVINRYNANSQVSATVVQKLIPLIMDLSSMLFYFVAMLVLSVPLALVGLATCGLNLWVSYVSAKRKLNSIRVMNTESAALNSATLSGIDLIETIKASGTEDSFFEDWADKYAHWQEHNVAYVRQDQTLGQLPAFLQILSADIVLFAGAALVMNGSWLPGIVLAFNGFLSAFQSPVASLLVSLQSFQTMRSDMERIQDVMTYEVQADPDEEIMPADIQHDGLLELQSVSFGYNRLKEPVVKDISVKINPGERVAIVGGSGSGKSTIASLIVHLYDPWEGTITLGGTDISKIPHDVLCARVAFVTQDAFLFEDTVFRNITMLDETIPVNEAVRAAQAACIHNSIMSRPEGYNRVLNYAGRDYSGGQRQRLEIASALVRKPELLILDEATAGLDAETEFEVIRNVSETGITTLIISHRLSIIRDCDRIYVLDQGSMIDCGRHEELMKRCEKYRALVTNN